MEEKWVINMKCDAIKFGYWLVNSPKKEVFSLEYIQEKYMQYLREEIERLKRKSEEKCL